VTVDDVFQALRERDAVLVVGAGGLRYIGPSPLAPDDLLRAAIREHCGYLIELFTFAPGGRCVFRDCYRLLASGGKVSCLDHRRELDATLMPWGAMSAGRVATRANMPSTNSSRPAGAVDRAR
jgi:hypothetical protein